MGDHCTIAFPSISIPRRPARPVSWVYSPGVIGTCASPFHFVNFSRMTVFAGMLMPRASVSVAKTAFTNPRLKRSSTVSLKLGNNPAWCAAIPRSRASSHSSYPKISRSSWARLAFKREAVSTMSFLSSVFVSLNPEKTHCFTAASQAAREKMNVIAGSKPCRSRVSIISGRDNLFSDSSKRSRRWRGILTLRIDSRSRAKSSGLIFPGSLKRSTSRFPIRTC